MMKRPIFADKATKLEKRLIEIKGGLKTRNSIIFQSMETVDLPAQLYVV